VVHEAEKQIKNFSCCRQDPVACGAGQGYGQAALCHLDGITYLLKSRRLRAVHERLCEKHRLQHAQQIQNIHITFINGFDKLPDIVLNVQGLCAAGHSSTFWTTRSVAEITKGMQTNKSMYGGLHEPGSGPALIVADNGPGFIDSLTT
jgi:hypothetical protein